MVKRNLDAQANVVEGRSSIVVTFVKFLQLQLCTLAMGKCIVATVGWSVMFSAGEQRKCYGQKRGVDEGLIAHSEDETRH